MICTKRGSNDELGTIGKYKSVTNIRKVKNREVKRKKKEYMLQMSLNDMKNKKYT